VAQAQFPKETDSKGAFVRQQSAFRSRVTADGSSGFPAEAGRYHLYVSLACPWASRSIIVRMLKGLEDAVSMTILDPVRDERGWRFTAEDPDPLNGFDFLAEAYEKSMPGFEDRVTVPVLWDREGNRAVSNESAEIVRMLNSEFNEFAADPNGKFGGPMTVGFNTPSGQVFDISANSTAGPNGEFVVEDVDLGDGLGAFKIKIGNFGANPKAKVVVHVLPFQPKRGKGKLYLK